MSAKSVVETLKDYLYKKLIVGHPNALLQTLFGLMNKKTINTFILNNGDAAVDVSMLYEVAGNDEAYIQLMVQTFLKHMPSTIAKIERSYQEHDYEELYKTAHYAKSSLSVIKVSDMLEWVKAIETSGRHKIGLDELPAIIEKVKTRFLSAQQILLAKFQPVGNSL